MRIDAYGGHVSRWPPIWLRNRNRVPAILTEREGTWLLVDPAGETWPVACHEDVLRTADDPYGENGWTVALSSDLLQSSPASERPLSPSTQSLDGYYTSDVKNTGRDRPISGAVSGTETKRARIRLDVFLGKVGHYPFLAEALALLGKGTTAYANPRGASGLACRYKRATIRIGESSAWGYETADMAFLTALSDVVAWLGVGAEVTPGALGHHTMAKAYLDAGHKRQNRPCGALRSALLEHRVGARSDPPISDQRFEKVYELDLHDAYCWAATMPVPCGQVERFLDGDFTIPRNERRDYGELRPDMGECVDREGRCPNDIQPMAMGSDQQRDSYATWYARCTIFIPATLRNSPLCVKDAAGLVRPLRTKGAHTVYCWKEEAERMVAIGCVVIVHDGWGWRETAPILKEWAEWMHARRRDAPTQTIADLVKRCITAGIGRHGMAPESRRLVYAKDAPEGSKLVDATPTDAEPLAIVTEKDWDAPWLTHVHDYLVMLVRLWQYDRQVEEEADGNVIVASNTDAIYVLAPSRRGIDPISLGGVRERERRNWRAPYPRAAVWDGGERLPGRHGKEREQYR